jgi:hypothetical protein
MQRGVQQPRRLRSLCDPLPLHQLREDPGRCGIRTIKFHSDYHNDPLVPLVIGDAVSIW